MRLARSHVLIGIEEHSLIAGAKAVEQAFIAAVEKQALSEEIRIVETGSLGIIGHGVVVVVYPEGVTYVGVTKADVPEIVSEHLIKGHPVERLRVYSPPCFDTEKMRTGLVHKQPRIVLSNCGVIDPENLEEAIAGGDYQALEKVITEGIAPQGVTDEVTRSGLRGRGGAGFPTGKKWSLTAPGAEKYLVCNADEGEPGMCKDRLILEGDPHRLIEGMILAGYAIGVKKGYIYIRGEYSLPIGRMTRT
ncbi:MAG TPA: NADP oxidoreductase, partial [Candidatus Acetothermia bacterium]|nr:NADP oxidoreductase [Candidatus Acetothermia bacterium]